MADKKEIWATGRRKSATARVRIRPGSGKIVINDKAFDVYFPTEALRGFVSQPLVVSSTTGRYDIAASILGGGAMGQAGALRHGIARALIKVDESLRPVLKDSAMLTRDSRVKERKKSGQPGARRRFQFSKR